MESGVSPQLRGRQEARATAAGRRGPQWQSQARHTRGGEAGGDGGQHGCGGGSGVTAGGGVEWGCGGSGDGHNARRLPCHGDDDGGGVEAATTATLRSQHGASLPYQR